MTDYYFRFDPNFKEVKLIYFECLRCSYNDEWWKFIPENITEKDKEKIAALCVCPKCKGKNIEEVKPCQTSPDHSSTK